MSTATLSDKRQQKQSPFSIRFQKTTGRRLDAFAKASRRTKASIVDEAVEYYILVQTQKADEIKNSIEDDDFSEEEIIRLRELIQEGYDSGERVGIPTLKEVVAMAKKKYNH